MAGLFMWPRKIYYMYKTHSVKCSSIMLEQKAELAADASEQNNRETVHYIHSTAQLGTARPAVGSALALLCRRTIISYVLVLLLAKHLKIFAIVSYRAHKCTHVNCPTLNTHHTLKESCTYSQPHITLHWPLLIYTLYVLSKNIEACPWQLSGSAVSCLFRWMRARKAAYAAVG